MMAGDMTAPPSASAIEIRNVWKVFGEREGRGAGEVQRNGISKQQALERYNCVIGVADVSLEIRRGEIFCVMGLSGSGKSTLVRHINRLLEPARATSVSTAATSWPSPRRSCGNFAMSTLRWSSRTSP